MFSKKKKTTKKNNYSKTKRTVKKRRSWLMACIYCGRPSETGGETKLILFIYHKHMKQHNKCHAGGVGFGVTP